MTPEEMRARSAEKVKQVMDLMKVLHLTVESKEVIVDGRFIERQVFWTDAEKYPSAEPQTAAEETAEAPTEAVTTVTVTDEGVTTTPPEHA